LNNSILDIRNLKVRFNTFNGVVQAVRGVGFHIGEGETLAIVGESGCGKSVTALSIMRLIDAPGEIYEGTITLNGKNLIQCSEKQLLNIRGKEVSMIFQDPMTCLNPTMKIGHQIEESLKKHRKIRDSDSNKMAIELLQSVKIPNAEFRINQFPFQFSGGMRQRAMIAVALSCNPSLLIADEPTTALDVTIQSQIIDLLNDIQNDTQLSILLITHDLGVVADIAERVAIMYAGKILEEGNVEEVYYNPKHPYTIGLLNSVPKFVDNERVRLQQINGTPPDLINPPKACPFIYRCNHAMRICGVIYPDKYQIKDDHYVNCWLMHKKFKKIIEDS